MTQLDVQNPTGTGRSATYARAVRLEAYGPPEVLQVVDIPMPEPGSGEVLVEVRAAGLNPGEAAIRSGAVAEQFPWPLPSGEGSDLAGVVVAVGPDVSAFAVGDEVLGWSWTRSSHQTHTAIPVGQLVRKPGPVSWEAAGALYGVGVTAWAAAEAIDPQPGQTVAVSSAAGGVGSLVVQLLVHRGVRVLGIASDRHHEWLEAHGVVPVAYGDGLYERLLAAAGPGGVDALVDTHGPEYVDLAVALGVPAAKIETVIAHERAAEIGAQTKGSYDASTPEVLAEMAARVASGVLEVPIAAVYPLERVADAHTELELRHTRGKIVLIP